MKSGSPLTVAEYITSQEPDAKKRLNAIRKAIRSEFPEMEESIRYNMPAFCVNKIHVYFAAYKKHIGMYPVYGLRSLEPEIVRYRGKGTKDSLHFLYKDELPLDLITRIVKLKFATKKK